MSKEKEYRIGDRVRLLYDFNYKTGLIVAKKHIVTNKVTTFQYLIGIYDASIPARSYTSLLTLLLEYNISYILITEAQYKTQSIMASWVTEVTDSSFLLPNWGTFKEMTLLYLGKSYA